MEIVEFHFDRTPTVTLHVKEIIKKTRRRYWVMRHLRKNGLSQDELVRVYVSNLRSVIEYCDIKYGPMLTAEMSNDLSRDREVALQKFAHLFLDGIYGHWFPKREREQQRIAQDKRIQGGLWEVRETQKHPNFCNEKTPERGIIDTLGHEGVPVRGRGGGSIVALG